MTTIEARFDPWGPVSTVLYEINDFDFVLNTIANSGIEIEWRPLTRADAYSHGTRIRAFRRDISAAYAALDQDQRGLFVQIVVKSILRHREGEELRTKLVERLGDIGWTISEDGLLTTQDALISEQFFPANSEFDAYVAIRDVLARASREILLVDAYVGTSFLRTLKALNPPLAIRILTVAKNLKADFRVEAEAFKKQMPGMTVEMRATNDFHDRFIVIDDVEVYHVGASIKDAGNRAFMINHIQDPPNIRNIRQIIDQTWTAAQPLPTK